MNSLGIKKSTNGLKNRFGIYDVVSGSLNVNIRHKETKTKHKESIVTEELRMIKLYV